MLSGHAGPMAAINASGATEAVNHAMRTTADPSASGVVCAGLFLPVVTKCSACLGVGSEVGEMRLRHHARPMHPKKVWRCNREKVGQSEDAPSRQRAGIGPHILDFNVNPLHENPCLETASWAFISLKVRSRPEAVSKTF